MDKIKTGDLTRIFEFDRADLDEDARTVSLSFSSETPVERWFGDEVLVHNPENIRLGRLNDGAPLLWNHNLDDQVSVIGFTKWNRSNRVAISTWRRIGSRTKYQW